jgi:hypothetical protein
MESINQETENQTNTKQQTIEKETIEKTTAGIRTKILIETLEEYAANETTKS